MLSGNRSAKHRPAEKRCAVIFYIPSSQSPWQALAESRTVWSLPLATRPVLCTASRLWAGVIRTRLSCGVSGTPQRHTRWTSEVGRDALASVAGLGGEMADPQAIPDDDAWLDDEDGCVEVNTCSSQAVVRSRFGVSSAASHPWTLHLRRYRSRHLALGHCRVENTLARLCAVRCCVECHFELLVMAACLRYGVVLHECHGSDTVVCAWVCGCCSHRRRPSPVHLGSQLSGASRAYG